MDPAIDEEERLRRAEGAIAGLLKWGTRIAAAWIAAGMAIGLLAGAWPGLGLDARLGEGCATIGIILLIALPPARVALTSAIFLRAGDYLFAVIAGVVLVVMAAGFLLGIPHG